MNRRYYHFVCIVFFYILVFPYFLVASDLELKEAFPNLTFHQPVDLQHAGDGTNRIFVVSKPGVIYVFENNPNVPAADVFLDITDRVSAVASEMGLLGLAFHPDYENNGYFFVNYTAANPRRTVIARFEVSDTNPDSADAASELILLEYNQPFGNHNGGQVAFGPDGYLYIASGDGGGSGDTQGNAQNKENLLGTVIRIDVDNTDDGLNYAIPPDNPYVGNTEGYREEIFAHGLRNPWRMSFDFETGWLWCGDVGQVGWEIIHLIENGKNYGWNIIEGSHCFNPPEGCDTTGLEMPLFEYEWGVDGQAITGGYVYRGDTHPGLYGKYIYGDYVFGTIWALEYDGVNDPVNEVLFDTDYLISSFGIDEHGEIYIIGYTTNGRIYTIDSATSTDNDNRIPVSYRLHQNYPNPFNNETVISFSVPESERVSIEVFNLIGQRIATVTDEQYKRGDHSVTWNAAGMSSGVYFYRMRAGDFIETKRMVFLQ